MDSEKFTYSYSSATNSEVDKIVAKYTEPHKIPDSDIERLKKLDRRAELPGTVVGIAVGLAGVIILLIGILLVLSFDFFAAGIIVGLIGFALAASAPPVSKVVTRRSRDRYRDEILKLSERIKKGGA